MFVSLPILLISHKQIFFYVPKLLFSSPLTNRYFFIFPRYYSPSISHKRKVYVCSLSARPFLCSFSLPLSISSLSLSARPLPCLLARLFLHSLPTLFHSHICIFTSPSISSLSLSAHFPLSCLLARLFLHSLPTLFHSHICIFTSPSLYIFSLTPRTPSPLSSFSLYPRISPIFFRIHTLTHTKNIRKSIFLFKNLLTIKIKSLNT